MNLDSIIFIILIYGFTVVGIDGTLLSILFCYRIADIMLSEDYKDAFNTHSFENQFLSVILEFSGYIGWGGGALYRGMTLTPWLYFGLRTIALILATVWVLLLFFYTQNKQNGILLLASSAAGFLFAILDITCVILLAQDYTECRNRSGFVSVYRRACIYAMIIPMLVVGKLFVFWILGVVSCFITLKVGLDKIGTRHNSDQQAWNQANLATPAPAGNYPRQYPTDFS